MDDMNRLCSPFGGLATVTDARTRSISPENPTGEPGKGAMAVPIVGDPNTPHAQAAAELGKGWKARPFLQPKAGETVTIMDVDGPGTIQHIWLATEPDWKGNGRACVLRFYWDGEDTPSIEVPMTDFFAVGHDRFAPVNSMPVVVNGTSALNCYWPMPFRRHARITFTNELDGELPVLAFQITYAQTEVAQDEGYFHAQWNRSITERSTPIHSILDGTKGKGHYVGTFLAWTQLSDGWFGESEIKFFMDGDQEYPTIVGTGTEDYFCASYGFPKKYSAPYVGCTLTHSEDDGPTKWSLYRWHIPDPIRFQEELSVNIQALGWLPTGTYQPLADDIASVAYWYQLEPHTEFPEFPELMDRWPR